MQLDFSEIKNTKNLLAFSAGIDSTALFFLLLENNISFDIAIVNYNLRSQSKDEVDYAKQLAKEYNKKIFLKEVSFETEPSNFEKKARDIRYDFFDEIIKKNSYETLITAHQLNDKLEWFLMQLTKGAGLFELIGFEKWVLKNEILFYKPLLEVSKEELKNYLDKNSLKYFIDNSNENEKYKRNYFRHNFSDKLIAEFGCGIKNSFEYLQNDLNSLNKDFTAIKSIKELDIFKNLNDDNLNIRLIDLNIKKRGYLLSKAQRDEILTQKEISISDTINIAINDDFIYICPKVLSNMDKKFKEECRVNKIPKNIRPYLNKEKINIKELIF